MEAVMQAEEGVGGAEWQKDPHGRFRLALPQMPV